MQHIENIQGILVGGYNVNNTCYADDTVLIAEDEEQLQSMLNIVVEESEKKGLSLNGLKTETMVVSRKGIDLICSFNIEKKGFSLNGIKTETMVIAHINPICSITIVEILLNKSTSSNIWEQF